MITIYDIAKSTGYSPTTVSKALNNYKDISEKAKRIILETAESMGYLGNANARALTTKRSYTIGVLFVEILNMGIRHPFFGAVIESFKNEAEIKGYDILFISKDLGGKKISYLDHCRFRGIDGVIVVCTNYEDREVQELIHSEIPCVLIDVENDDNPTVCSDNIQGSIRAMEYLYALGHRKIAHIGGEETTPTGNKRRTGYQAALQKLGLSYREEYVVNGGYFSVDGGFGAMNKLLSLTDPPTAVFAAGDSMAIGAIKAANQRGIRVPEDISIIGFDDIDLSQHIFPPLTTIRQDTKLMGMKAAEILVAQINGSHEKSSFIASVDLIIRESCRKI